MSGNDIVAYCIPDFGKCGASFNEVGPAFKESIDFLVSMKWTSAATDGDKDFLMDPPCAFWFNMPLCIGMYCVPCCACAVQGRNMEKMTGASYEAECLKMVALSCCGCYVCYYPKKRGEFRAKYGLKGSPLMDCLGTCCWGPCLTCQDAVELMRAGDYTVPMCSLDEASKAREGAYKAAANVKDTVAKVVEPKKEEAKAEEPKADEPKKDEAKPADPAPADAK
uniref:Uncharacterized protein n=1 Tax=Chlamydomonas leiostraca TaxID=1034604 RepID=A0A7S0WM66_9CHLO|eukprot:CAMPEP_0202857876 /NCGR_PEP_ID=MMETSP1391-20130828/647_1 /ASSEMBLY_ACC=CAM_ASM_000867 /TAXON_ID=1034604 /ORGANISM="Chlamydomonas leiostraca, Strain SAG 11-49" /LENGTH=222 /DNA_ID=CAMNT_0049536735 /DNA_START=36 /DNA_END=704 /DNA_ORIENTATION=-